MSLEYEPYLPARAGVVGCGVIGAAWASRMLLKGVDVMISDPAPNAEDVLGHVLARRPTARDEAIPHFLAEVEKFPESDYSRFQLLTLYLELDRKPKRK